MRIEPQDPAVCGQIIAGRYTVGETIGRGASGVVYRATTDDGTNVALKLLFREFCDQRQLAGRLEREGQILRRLRGRHIVNFLDFIEHDGLLGIALEQVEGESLEERLTSPLSLTEALSIGCQLCAGLEEAHALGVVHRDLKPANIMVTCQPELLVQILDFGMAKVVFGDKLVTGLTERDMIFGTPEYMAPEQARGEDTDHRCDIYAAGVILYEMFAGSVPLSRRTPLATMTAQLTEPIEAPRKRAPERAIGAAIEAVILRALEKDPQRRYQTATQLREALLAAAERRLVNPSLQPEADIMGVNDTELALRRSQIGAPSTELLAQAKALSDRKSAQQAAAPATREAASSTVLTIMVIALSIMAGLWLALR